MLWPKEVLLLILVEEIAAQEPRLTVGHSFVASSMKAKGEEAATAAEDVSIPTQVTFF